MTLDDLGPRVCILGPPNSGKSTLAVAIAHARGLTPVHLDLLYHLPNTDWEPRPEVAFIALHDEALAGTHWVMEGNYSRCLPQRLARATGLILLDIPTTTSLFRYLRRSWLERARPGALEGGRDSVKWDMIRHIAVTTRENRRRYAEMCDRISLPQIRLSASRDIARFYQSERLSR
jgi:adenylate kinase family enzyme